MILLFPSTPVLMVTHQTHKASILTGFITQTQQIQKKNNGDPAISSDHKMMKNPRSESLKLMRKVSSLCNNDFQDWPQDLISCNILYMTHEAPSPYFGLGYNSFRTFATVNHLHFQLTGEGMGAVNLIYKLSKMI
nr:GDP-L-galactose phosphorylase 2-like [Tanacetum cinerariifolium]